MNFDVFVTAEALRNILFQQRANLFQRDYVSPTVRAARDTIDKADALEATWSASKAHCNGG